MKKKILFVIPSITQSNGVSSFLMNYLKYMGLSDLDITVLTSDLRPSKKHILFLKEKGIKLFLLPDLKVNGLKIYLKNLKDFFKKNHDYDIVYSNVANQSLFIFYLAKKYGIKHLIVHSHATISSSSKVKKVINDVINVIVQKYATDRVACSKLAGEAMFGNKSFKIVNNAVDYDIYKFSIENRNEIRKKYNIQNDCKLIGFVGRFAPQKNVFFFIDLIEKLDKKYKVMMIGTGPQRDEFIKQCENKKLIDRFIFIDECNDVYNYYSAFDVFLLPSHYEGLPVVSIEAQVNGLPCLLSDTITLESRIISNIIYLQRTEIEQWKNALEKIEERAIDNIVNTKFDIRIQAKCFEEMLKKMCL